MNNIEIIAGRPGSGKTLLATQICRSYVNNKSTVVYFSIELSSKYLLEKFGIPKEVNIVDNHRNDWNKIKKSIITLAPELCIIDYLQLVKDFESSLLGIIIDDIQKLKINTKIIILSQVSKITEEEGRLPMPEDIHMSSIPPGKTNIKFISLAKDIHEIPATTK